MWVGVNLLVFGRSLVAVFDVFGGVVLSVPLMFVGASSSGWSGVVLVTFVAFARGMSTRVLIIQHMRAATW